VGRITKELWLLLFLVLIAAMLNFLAASQRMALMFYFMPTLYSAYYFGRRHATLTAFASVFLVVLLTYTDPAMFSRQVSLPFDSRWFDLTLWGGILVVSAYTMGTLYGRNQKSLQELGDGYDGLLVIVQHFLSNEKYSESHSFRIAMYSTKIAESLGLDAGTIEDVHTAALLRNMNELGISNELLYRAANLSQEDLEKSMQRRRKSPVKAQVMGGSLRRAVPILVAQQRLAQDSENTLDALIEVQVLAVAEVYDSLITGKGAQKMSPAHAQEVIMVGSGTKYDSMVVDAFMKAFGHHVKGTGAGT
jgi:hypothetical protein